MPLAIRGWSGVDSAEGGPLVYGQLSGDRSGMTPAFDVVLMPVTPTPAPAHHNKSTDRSGRRFHVDGTVRSYWDQVKWSAIANIAGAPATTIPIGLAKSGLPIGLQAMGPAGGVLTTIQFATLLGKELGGYLRPPTHST